MQLRHFDDFHRLGDEKVGTKEKRTGEIRGKMTQTQPHSPLGHLTLGQFFLVPSSSSQNLFTG